MKSTGITSPFNITPRIANKFCSKSSLFSSEIYIEKNGKRVNAKNILGLVSVLIMNGDNFKLIANGDDEDKALEILTSFFVENKKERK